MILDRFSHKFNKFLDEQGFDSDDEESDGEELKTRELVDDLAEEGEANEAFARVLSELAAHQPSEPVRLASALGGAGGAAKKRSRPISAASRSARPNSRTSEDEMGTSGGIVTIDEDLEEDFTAQDPELAQLKKARRSATSPVSQEKEDTQVYKVAPIPFDAGGNPVLPVSLNMVTLHELGAIVHDRPAYHTRRNIMPVGFHTTRTYLSCLDPNEGLITYHSVILDNGPAPLYQVYPEGHPESAFTSASSTGVWNAVAKAAAQIRGKDSAPAISGPDYFGFSNPTISMLIERLPNANLCDQYQPKKYEVSNLVGGKQVKRAATESTVEVEKEENITE